MLPLVAVGIASWFTPYQREYDGLRVCAMPARSMISEHVQIVDTDNGRKSTCVVIGTGPFVAGRVIDVSPLVRDDLGMYAAGLAHVRVYRLPCWPTPTPQTCRGLPMRCGLPPPAGCR